MEPTLDTARMDACGYMRESEREGERERERPRQDKTRHGKVRQGKTSHTDILCYILHTCIHVYTQGRLKAGR